MGMTIAEKIIALAAGVPEVKAGDIHTVTLDRMMSNDGTTHLTVDMYNNKLKHPHIADREEDGLYRGSQCSVRTARRPLHPRRRCATSQERTTLISGRARAYATRS